MLNLGEKITMVNDRIPVAREDADRDGVDRTDDEEPDDRVGPDGRADPADRVSPDHRVGPADRVSPDRRVGPDRRADPADRVDPVADALHSAALRLLRRARVADAGMDLDGPRASALSVLVFVGPQQISRLAAIEQVSPPAMTKTVTALETAGLVRRERHPTDRRIVLVTATDAGRDLLHDGRRARVRLVADLLTGLPAADRATLHAAATILLTRVLSPPRLE
jgi:DNA-binding MarR family transcriptional regulator